MPGMGNDIGVRKCPEAEEAGREEDGDREVNWKGLVLEDAKLLSS